MRFNRYLRKEMKKTYTWICDCGHSAMHQMGYRDARKTAREHLRGHMDKTPNWTVIIDQYDEREGELSGRYYTIEKNK